MNNNTPNETNNIDSLLNEDNNINDNKMKRFYLSLYPSTMVDNDLSEIVVKNDTNMYGATVFAPQKTFDSEKYLSGYPDFNKKMNKIKHLYLINDIKELIELKNYFKDLQLDYDKISCNPLPVTMTNAGCVVHYSRFNDEINEINNKIKALISSFFKKNIFTENETINGYSIGSLINAQNRISYDLYLEFKVEWNNDSMTYEEFKEKFKNIACSEWYRNDMSLDNPFDADNENITAEELLYVTKDNFENNCQALYKLPYSKKFILYTIKFGCNNLIESVKFSNFLCEWMKRMMTRETCQKKYNF